MSYDEDTAWIIWPEYFDKSRSRAQGRRVNRRLAVHGPTLEAVEKAVRALGLEYKLESDKLYPANWSESQGRIRVERSLGKTELLQRLGRELVAQRS